MKRQRAFILAHQQARERAARFILDEAQEGDAVNIGEPNRTSEQNSAQWPYLAAWSQGVEWMLNGKLTKLTEDDWKDILTAAWRGESQNIVPGLNGGFVMLGQRTSQFGKAEFSEWLEFLIAATTTRGLEPIFKNPRREREIVR